MSRKGSLSKGLTAVLLLIALQGCSLSVYDKCRAKAQSLDDLDDCMTGKGYAFIPENLAWDPGLSECWDDRYANKFPMAYCYRQVGPPVYQ